MACEHSQAANELEIASVAYKCRSRTQGIQIGDTTLARKGLTHLNLG